MKDIRFGYYEDGVWWHEIEPMFKRGLCERKSDYFTWSTLVKPVTSTDFTEWQEYSIPHAKRDQILFFALADCKNNTQTKDFTASTVMNKLLVEIEVIRN